MKIPVMEKYSKLKLKNYKMNAMMNNKGKIIAKLSMEKLFKPRNHVFKILYKLCYYFCCMFFLS